MEYEPQGEIMPQEDMETLRDELKKRKIAKRAIGIDNPNIILGEE